jgi:hypothetical protein
MPLTDVKIRNAKPTDKPFKIFDGQGLYLEVSPAGGKLWRLKYRFNGKEKRLGLGKYPEVGLSEARQERDGLRALLKRGIVRFPRFSVFQGIGLMLPDTPPAEC